MPQKLTKTEAGYQCKPDTEYCCQDCVLFKPEGSGCAWFGPADAVKAEQGSCNYFAHGPCDQIPWQGLYSKPELGYLENQQGFSCKRCEHFSLEERDCKRVDRNSQGDTPGEIHPNSCCNLWDPDEKRARMPTGKLLDFIASLDKGAGKMTPEEYRSLREKR